MTPAVLIQTAPEPGGPDFIELLIAFLAFLGTISWPVAACLVVWWFREPIKAKINEATTLEGFGMKLLLADALGRAKEIMGEAAIQEEPDSVTAEGAQLEVKVELNPGRATGTVDLEADGVSTPSPEVGTPTLTASPTFEQMAAIAPAAAILLQWDLIEERLGELAHIEQLPFKSRTTSHLIKHLEAAGSISSRLASIIRDLNQVRNSAAHQIAKVGFTPKEVIEFRDASTIVVQELDEAIMSARRAPKP